MQTAQSAEDDGQATWTFFWSPPSLRTRLFRLAQDSMSVPSAVAEFQGIQLSGIVAWFLWRSVYLFKLPAWARRFQVGFDWASGAHDFYAAVFDHVETRGRFALPDDQVTRLVMSARDAIRLASAQVGEVAREKEQQQQGNRGDQRPRSRFVLRREGPVDE